MAAVRDLPERWRHNVRSYVRDGGVGFAKDLRTAIEVIGVEGVLAGGIDEFLIGALRLGVGRPRGRGAPEPEAV